MGPSARPSLPPSSSRFYLGVNVKRNKSIPVTGSGTADRCARVLSDPLCLLLCGVCMCVVFSCAAVVSHHRRRRRRNIYISCFHFSRRGWPLRPRLWFVVCQFRGRMKLSNYPLPRSTVNKPPTVNKSRCKCRSLWIPLKTRARAQRERESLEEFVPIFKMGRNDDWQPILPKVVVVVGGDVKMTSGLYMNFLFRYCSCLFLVTRLLLFQKISRCLVRHDKTFTDCRVCLCTLAGCWAGYSASGWLRGAGERVGRACWRAPERRANQ